MKQTQEDWLKTNKITVIKSKYKKTLGPKKSVAYKHSTGIHSVKRAYGISESDIRKLQDAQQGCCKICGVDFGSLKRRCDVDHCHHTSKIRGLLCGGCNVAVGKLEDNRVSKEIVLQYLKTARVPMLSKIKNSIPTHNKQKRSAEGMRHKANMYTLADRFGINEAQFQYMLNLQKGVCKLCGADLGLLSRRSSIDHNHASGLIRGLVCTPCNALLGVYESPLYTRYIEYIKAN